MPSKTPLTNASIKETMAHFYDNNHRKQVTYWCPKYPGLGLRLSPKACSFVLKKRFNGKQRWFSIGDPKTDKMDAIHKRYHKANALLKEGIDPSSWIAESRNEKPTTKQPVRDNPDYLYPAMVNVFAASYDNISTARSYKIALLNKATKEHWMDKDVRDIDSDDVQFIINEYAKLSSVKADSFKRTLSPFIKYARKDLRAKGIQNQLHTIQFSEIDMPSDKDEAFKEAAEDQAKRRTRKAPITPTVDQLREAVTKFKALESPKARMGCLLTLFTAQRRLSVAAALKTDFNDNVWTVSHTKVKRDNENEFDLAHTIPLTPTTHFFVLSTKTVFSHPNSSLLLPRLKAPTNRKGREAIGISREDDDEQPDASFITKGFRESDVGFSPHDVRRGFVYHLIRYYYNEKMADYVKLVLDHSEGRKGTTSLYYNQAEYLHIKKDLLTKWENILDSSFELPQPLDLMNNYDAHSALQTAISWVEADAQKAG